MKKSILIFCIGIILFNGCSRKHNLKPLVENCCETKQSNKIKSKIYIGTYKLTDSENKKNNFGLSIVGEENNKEQVKFSDSITEIFRNELKRRLKLITTKEIRFVDKKPKKLTPNDIYIYGYIKKILINQHVKYKGAFILKNTYLLNISTNINNKNLEDKLLGKLYVQNYNGKEDHTSAILVGLFINPMAFGNPDVQSNLIYKFELNNQKVAEIKYSHFSEPIGFKKPFEAIFNATIYNKNGTTSNYSDSIKGWGFDMMRQGNIKYAFLSGNNLNAFIPVGPTVPGTPTYMTKSKIKKINDCYNTKKIEINESCNSVIWQETNNTQFFDIFRLYTTTTGILQYMLNEHIDNIINTINNNKD